MAPKTDRPKLADLDPRAVAHAACVALCEHISRHILFDLGPHIEFRLLTDAEYRGTQLGQTTELLTIYAQTGRAGDWEDDPGCAVDGIQSVCEALYSQAGLPGTFGLGAIEQIHTGVPEDPIGLVIVAAYARTKLASRACDGITPREIATLAGVTDHQIRHLGRAGEIAIEGGLIARAEARRFLAARGVPGFRRASSRS